MATLVPLSSGMQRSSATLSEPSVPVLSGATTNPSEPPAITSSPNLDPSVSPPPASSISWTDRGHYHFNRKEYDLAIDAFTKALHEAEEKKNLRLVGLILNMLGRAFLEKEQWVLAAKILNGALAVMQKDVSPDKTAEMTTLSILSYLAELERRFLKNECKIKASLRYEIYLNRRKQLRAMRDSFKTRLQSHDQRKDNPVEFSRRALDDFSNAIAQLLEEILKSGYALFGKPPCEFTLIGLGSLARKEMSPYSDLEFALLIKKSSPSNLDYFRKLIRWLEIQVINLGETEIKILERGYGSPVRRGFSFDDGGNTPLGKESYVELIKEPQAMAEFQSVRFYEEDLILSNVLRTAGMLVGEKALYTSYLKSMRAVLSEKSTETAQLTISQRRALNLIKGHLVEFEPDIGQKKEETPLFNIKAELYRLPSFLIAGIADYFGIEEQNSWDKLDALLKRNILSAKAVSNLQQALAKILRLRIRCHLHYGRECDEAYHPAMQKVISKEKIQQAFVLSDEAIEEIIEIYRVIFSLHRVFKEIVRTTDLRKLAQEEFYDDSLVAQGRAHMKLFQHQKALECFRQAIALNPDDVKIQLEFVGILVRQAQFGEAKKYIEKLLISSGAKDEEFMLDILQLQGDVSFDLDNQKEAVEHFNKALALAKKLYGNEHAEVAACLGELARVWSQLGDYKKALEYQEEALRITKKICGVEDPKVVGHLNSLGHICLNLGVGEKALAYHEEALKITKKVSNDEQLPKMMSCLSGLGDASLELGNAKKAREYYEEAHQIAFKAFGVFHPHVAAFLHKLGRTWQRLGDAKKAMGYYKDALSIQKAVFGNEHSSVAITLGSLAGVCCDLGNTSEALAYYEEDLRITRKVYGDDHPAVATNLSNLGVVYTELGQLQKALECHKEALRISRKAYGDVHPDVASILNNLGFTTHEMGDAKKAVEYYEEALQIDKKIFGPHHPTVGTVLNNLAAVLMKLGNAEKALAYYEEALQLKMKINGEVHPEVALIAYNVGITISEELVKIMKINENEHLDASTRLQNAGMISLYAKKAYGCFEKALTIWKKMYNDEHPKIKGVLQNLRTAKMAVMTSCLQALPITKKMYSNEHPEVVTCLINLGKEFLDLAMFQQALNSYEEALQIAKKLNGDSHSTLVALFKMLALVCHKMSNSEKAAEYFDEARKIENQETFLRWQQEAEQGDAEALYQLSECYYHGRWVNKDEAKARALCEKAAAQGHLAAKGDCYALGYGVPPDRVEAMSWYHKAAEQGNVKMQFDLGMSYLRGKEVNQSYEEAVKWFHKAAAQGHMEAQFQLSQCYKMGRGVPKDEAKAQEWVQKAAAQGYLVARGFCYEFGYGVERDPKEAAKLYYQSAEKGNADAQFRLGYCYFAGKGLTKDPAQAVKWFQKAAMQKHSDAQFWLGQCYCGGHGIQTNFSEATKWFHESALQGDPDAQNMLGMCYKYGQGVNQNHQEAFKWFQKAAIQGHIKAQVALGEYYEEGPVIAQNYNEAFKWFHSAANKGDAEAQYRVGRCYDFAQGVAKDFKKAVEWYQKAVAQEYPPALFNLGRSYEDGEGVTKDCKEAMRLFLKAAELGYAKAQSHVGYIYHEAKKFTESAQWYRKAAEQGHGSACKNLGLAYQMGEGVPKDTKQAVQWFHKGATAGDAGSLCNLGKCYEKGTGVAQSDQEAIRCYTLAANLGDSYAQANLGVYFYKAQKYTQALEWFRKSAAQGNADAMNNLGVCYERGHGVVENYFTSQEWYRKAANKGHAGAKKALGIFS